MLGLLRRRRGQDGSEAPPVVVPADAIRPGEDDRALIRAVVAYVRAMRRDGAYAFRELHPDAVRAFAVDEYLAQIEQGGHAAYLADPPPPALLARCQEGLEQVAPALAKLHGRVTALLHRDTDGSGAKAAELDEAFHAAGGRAAADAALAGMIARINGLEVVPPERYSDRLAEVAAAHPDAGIRFRDLRIAELDAALTSPVPAGVAIILARTLGRCPPFRLGRHQGAAEAEQQWHVETAAEDFRAAWYPDRLVLFRALPDGGGFTGLGHLAHEKIALTCDWAERSHAALAAIMGLEEIGAADHLSTIIFDRRKTLKKSGAEAAAFHLALEEGPDLALVVFPKACAIVDPRTNERLAEIDHETLHSEAEAHVVRMAALLD